MEQHTTSDTGTMEQIGDALVPPRQRSLFGLLERPRQGCHPIIDWMTTVDHKKIGIVYAVAALFFLLVGGMEALIIRAQLMIPENALISARVYNQLFTMHGTTMIFLAVMPLSSAFFNFIMVLQIGARDVAFPRLNAFSLWTFIFGGILLNLSWLFSGGAPAIGWFGYAPLSLNDYSPEIGTDFWVMSLQILGVSSLAASLNFITTILNMRAPGMSLMRLPVFTWMTLITAFLVILAFPAITVALVELMMDRQFGTHFFDESFGGKPILWQHLFWIFGHPEVYILILPAMGIISEILPVFSRKPLFGYPLIVFSGAVIGFLGFAVWSHHMFTTGLGVVATSAFSILTMLIALPTGVKIFNWIGTLWGGKISFTTPMLFATGFVWMFMIGGFTGIMHASVPVDAQQQDTYFVVAHFHYVLIGGALFALIGGIYYWFPLITGKQMNEAVGKVVYWIMFAGFNIAFFPMHFLGMTGMPRRTHTYKSEMGWNEWNMWSTIGALILGLGIGIFVIQILYSVFKAKKSKKDPWDARTIEWTLSHPPKEYNYERIPIIKSRDQLFENKYGPSELKMDYEAADEHGIHMPGRSWYPLIGAFGLFCGAFGMILKRIQLTDSFWIAITGGVILLVSIYLWALEGDAAYYLKTDSESSSEDEEGPAC